ncbi:hypothetical protein L1987_26602 [Smallanthus sonchifolius]|uniref:Uncharacterized protein n=1 Tax=Smallanthus sonchifolius TaxID=185202 RepID=A0ACB9IBD8_9ASTR|nr:hypothetical protein L1987_26602 [Smallanthus sonchifolius]
MKDRDAAKKEGLTVSLLATTTNGNGTIGGAGALFSKTRYKFWAIAAILLLALWSMFTGSVTLKWSGAGNVNNPLSDSFDSPIRFQRCCAAVRCGGRDGVVVVVVRRGGAAFLIQVPKQIVHVLMNKVQILIAIVTFPRQNREPSCHEWSESDKRVASPPQSTSDHPTAIATAMFLRR